MSVDGRSVILITFAGRRDRMELLTRYAGEAIRRNLVDEWHVWDYSRTDDDGRWLADRFPVLGRSANDLVYSAAGELYPGSPWRARVRAANDVYIGIKPRDVSSVAAAFEFVIGGWRNQRTVLRRVENTEFFAVRDHERLVWRDPLVGLDTPGILSTAFFRDLEVSLSTSGLTVTLDGVAVLSSVAAITPTAYQVYVKTGYGADGEWRFPGRDAGQYLYHARHKALRKAFHELYQFYSTRADYYGDTVFLKCDDDIVYFQIDRLVEFIRFRLSQQRYFLASANVINNNVCAYYQQQNGAIPHDLMELELPEGGLCGRLWGSATMASMLHNYFLDNRKPFEEIRPAPIPWDSRLSINFVSWLGRDLSYMSAINDDDEHALSVTIPKYLQRPNCIYPGFLASHLSYYAQDAQIDHEALLARYRKLAAENGLAADEE